MNIAQRTIQKILEVFNSSYPFTHKQNSSDQHSYRFDTPKGSQVHVDIGHHRSKNGRDADVTFYDRADIRHGEHKYTANNLEGESAHKLLSTVHQILKKHVNENPDVTHVTFTGDKDHAPVYRRMARKFATSHEENKDDDGDTHFIIDKKNLK